MVYCELMGLVQLVSMSFISFNFRSCISTVKHDNPRPTSDGSATAAEISSGQTHKIHVTIIMT